MGRLSGAWTGREGEGQVCSRARHHAALPAGEQKPRCQKAASLGGGRGLGGRPQSVGHSANPPVSPLGGEGEFVETECSGKPLSRVNREES